MEVTKKPVEAALWAIISEFGLSPIADVWFKIMLPSFIFLVANMIPWILEFYSKIVKSCNI